MLDSKELFAGRRGAAIVLAFILSLFVQGQVSARTDPEMRAPSYERTVVGKSAFIQRASNSSELGTKPSTPPSMLAGAPGVRTSANFYPEVSWATSAASVSRPSATSLYDARAPPAA